MHPDVKLSVEKIQNSEAAHNDQNYPEYLPELLANGMVIELKPDSSNTDDRPDASTCTCSDLLWLEYCRQNITLVRTQADNQYKFLPRSDLFLYCESDEKHTEAVVNKLKQT